MPVRAYQLIWNEFYRDQDLEAEAVISRGDGLDTVTNGDLRHCAWEKDYFTSARPWTQKGPDVSLPIGIEAPVLPDGTLPTFRAGLAGAGLGNLYGRTSQDVDIQNVPVADTPLGWHNTGLKADLTGATAVNINDLRRAFALQRYEEARARYGSRYTEYLRYLGVRSSDARLQRPEYLGGGKQTIQFSEVLQTGPYADDEGVATLRGHGVERCGLIAIGDFLRNMDM